MKPSSKKSIKTGSVNQLVQISSFLSSSVIDICVENLVNKYTSDEDLFEIILKSDTICQNA